MSNLDYISATNYDPDGFMDALFCQVAEELGYDLDNLTEAALDEICFFVYGGE